MQQGQGLVSYALVPCLILGMFIAAIAAGVAVVIIWDTSFTGLLVSLICLVLTVLMALSAGRSASRR